MKEPLISIVIPVYNVEEYLEECLNLLIFQTYKNIELIIIDDGSVDNSGLICDRYANQKSFITVIHQKNHGVSFTRNYGIKISKGEYIIFVDPDDYMEKDYVEGLYNIIVKNNSDIGICGYLQISESKDVLKNVQDIKKNMGKEEALKELFNDVYFGGELWNKIFKADVARKVQFDITKKVGEDIEFVYNSIALSNSIEINTVKKLYYYRIRKNSAMRSNFNIEEWKEEVLLMEQCVDKIQEQYPNIVNYIVKRYFVCSINSMKKCVLDGYSKYKNDYMWFRKKIISKKKYIFSINDVKIKIKLVLIIYFNEIYKVIYLLKSK